METKITDKEIHQKFEDFSDQMASYGVTVVFSAYEHRGNMVGMISELSAKAVCKATEALKLVELNFIKEILQSVSHSEPVIANKVSGGSDATPVSDT
jgi:hypothetical protein